MADKFPVPFEDNLLLEDLKETISVVAQRHNTSSAEIVHAISRLVPEFHFHGENDVPVSVFTCDYSPLQALVTFLHIDRGYTFKEIAAVLNRPYSTIWNACMDAAANSPKSEFSIPLKQFSAGLSILETIVTYLHIYYGLSFARIGALLKRDQRTVWTSWNRAVRKKRNLKDGMI